MRQKQRVGRYPTAFRQRAVERTRHGESVAAVAKDLGIDPGMIYRWRQMVEQAESTPGPEVEGSYKGLQKELQQVKQLLAEKVLELDFFRGALQKVEARRRRSGRAGEKASLPKSGK